MLGRAAILLAIAATPLLLRAEPQVDDQVLHRGEEISGAVSNVTSTAISPLLGVCVLGIYHYISTPADGRASLPLYSRPQFWIPIGFLLILIFLKDTIGGLAPLIKKPLDAIEVLFLSKASLVLVAVPFMLHQVSSLLGIRALASLEPVVYAAGNPSLDTARHIVLTVLMLTAGILLTVVVWVVGHAIDVLVLLSPFAGVDVLLKGFRTALVLAITAAAVLDWRIGLAISLVVIALCLLLFSHAWRLVMLGTLFAWDIFRLMLFGRRATLKPGKPILGFTVGRISGLPRQTLVRLSCDANGVLQFRTGRWWGPSRLIQLGDASNYQLGRGVLYPCIVVPARRGNGYVLQFRLLPRYNGLEEALRAELALGGFRDLFFSKGIRAFWRWVEGPSKPPDTTITPHAV